MRRIGIDVGGTNTDAVMLDDGKVAHAIKTPTTSDVTSGIVTALEALRRRPEIARSTSMASSTLRVIGPSLSRDQQSVIAPVRATRP